MFKKLKDKLAEEVKSSPQRIQQFAQAAQAAVTSASSSISDITNNDLFSIGDNDSQQSRPIKSSPTENKTSTPTFQDVSLVQPGSFQTSNDSMDFSSAHDTSESHRQRRLSNSSFASDVSFRLPSYESPSMYHLQSDMEVSASEAEERGFSSGNVSLDRVTKEQIYAAYRRTQERYSKYRTQYADLARHYKLLERENAKARSVLVETQDKALRRISELREQCSLEQSAKAHLEKALRVEIEEKNLKIDTLNTKIKLIQNDIQASDENDKTTNVINDNNSIVQLITFDSENNQTNDEQPPSETHALNNKIEKLEQLVNKYKDSLKTTKEKSAQLTTEIQILSSGLESKNKEIEQFKTISQQLEEAKQKILKLNDENEELQNKNNVYEFNKNKQMSALELDFQKAQEEIMELQGKIDIFTKREEEYAISLAENKLSIHKELESKEREIKSLKNLLTESKQEIQSLDIMLNDYKVRTTKFEEECTKLKSDINELSTTRLQITELESQIQTLTQKCQSLENMKSKADEEYKCLQLQLKQETAEKLAMIDRNTYLENRNTQLTEENAKKSLQITTLEKDFQMIKSERDNKNSEDSLDKAKLTEDIDLWKNKCTALETEIQEEREELGKLQSEIEKLLVNDEHIQIKNAELNTSVNQLKAENKLLRETQLKMANIRTALKNISLQIKEFKIYISSTMEETNILKNTSNDFVTKVNEVLDNLLKKQKCLDEQATDQSQTYVQELEKISLQFSILKEENSKLMSKLSKFQERDEKLRHVNEEYEQTLNNLRCLQDEKSKLSDLLKESEFKCQELQKSIEHYKSEHNILEQKVNDMNIKLNDYVNNNELLKKENQMLNEQLIELNIKSEELKTIIKSNDDQQTALNKNCSNVSSKIKELQKSNELLQNEKQVLGNEIVEANAKCEILQDLINRNNNEQTILKEKVSQLDHSIELLQNEKIKVIKDLEDSNAKCEILQDIINRNNNEQSVLKETINTLELEIHTLKQDYENVLQKLEHTEKNKISIENLQQKIRDVTQENISLKTQSEDITNSIKSLEIELRDVRKSHAEMEVEKDNLNSIIEKLEASEHEKESIDQNTQTTDDGPEQMFKEIQLAEDLSQISKDENKQTDQTLVNENDDLKDENTRLKSDVAGLQAYLTKVSKENSALNDKIRELIATSENSHDNHNNTDLSDEVQLGKDRLHDLIRENNLLVEENLELKDQINSQHLANNGATMQIDKDTEYQTLKEKYSSLLDINSRLEKRMIDLEQMNQSVNGNVTQMQQHNEKLKLANEKLERRLDEALVSLRHLHALQENTELEYLRNILYEYLTGTGAHSVTLAKVLAAVVKFDKSQTELVLQKEKERQSFLRQLGLL